MSNRPLENGERVRIDGSRHTGIFIGMFRDKYVVAVEVPEEETDADNMYAHVHDLAERIEPRTGDLVYIYDDSVEHWDNTTPFKFIGMDGELYVCKTDHRTTDIYFTVSKVKVIPQ